MDEIDLCNQLHPTGCQSNGIYSEICKCPYSVKSNKFSEDFYLCSCIYDFFK